MLLQVFKTDESLKDVYALHQKHGGILSNLKDSKDKIDEKEIKEMRSTNLICTRSSTLLRTLT